MLNFGRTDVGDCLTKRVRAMRLRVPIVLAGSLTGVAGMLMCLGFDHARADDDKPITVASSASHTVNDSRAALARIHAQLADLATQVMSGIDLSIPSDSDLAVQKLRVDAANSARQQAVLAREAADLALHEFVDGVGPAEKKALEADIELAKAEVARAERAIPLAKERYERFKHVKTGSTADLARGWELEVGEVVARNKLKRAESGLEHAQSNLKMFHNFTYKHNLKDIKSRLAGASSHEFATRASWELEVSRLKLLERRRDPKARPLPISQARKHALELLAKTIPLEDKLSARLDQIKNDGAVKEADRMEIADLTHHLEQTVERADDAAQALAMVQLRAKLPRAAR